MERSNVLPQALFDDLDRIVPVDMASLNERRKQQVTRDHFIAEKLGQRRVLVRRSTELSLVRSGTLGCVLFLTPTSLL